MIEDYRPNIINIVEKIGNDTGRIDTRTGSCNKLSKSAQNSGGAVQGLVHRNPTGLRLAQPRNPPRAIVPFKIFDCNLKCEYSGLVFSLIFN